MELEAIICEVRENEGFFTFTPFADTYLLDKRGITAGRLILDDARRISGIQRTKIHALIGDITDFVCAPGNDKKRRERAELETLREMGLLYTLDRLEDSKSANRELIRRQLTDHYCNIVSTAHFSLSDVDMTTAKDFIDWLVEMCVQHDIPCLDTLLNRCEDIGRYLYACVMYRRCAVCGGRADIHEWGMEKPGMGRNRQKMHHVGQPVQPLCRGHHQEIEVLGQKDFDEKYHLTYVRLDDFLCERIGWKK